MSLASGCGFVNTGGDVVVDVSCGYGCRRCFFFLGGV